MDINRPCPLAAELAARMRDAVNELTTDWLERIAARGLIPPDRAFPSEELVDLAPSLIAAMADYVADPTDEVTADVPLVAKSTQLGELRFDEGFDASEILKEYDVLGSVLFEFCGRVAADSRAEYGADSVLVCGHRIFHAISVIEQVATSHYLRVLADRVGEREERLRRFNRMITHELKNRVGATLGAGQLLQEEWLGDGDRQRFAAMVTENAQAIQKVLENLIALSLLDRERRHQRNLPLRDVVAEVFRQLRDLARSRAVELRVQGELPDIEVSAAAVELCLSNYLSNAIKYSDASAAQRWAEVSAFVEERSNGQGGAELVVRVRDNGMGVPPEARDQIFQRFFRAHASASRVEGTGLGLSLVQETAESMGGRAWAEFNEESGSTFAFAMPYRRVADSAELRRGVSEANAAQNRGGRTPTGAARATAFD